MPAYSGVLLPRWCGRNNVGHVTQDGKLISAKIAKEINYTCVIGFIMIGYCINVCFPFDFIFEDMQVSFKQCLFSFYCYSLDLQLEYLEYTKVFPFT